MQLNFFMEIINLYIIIQLLQIESKKAFLRVFSFD